MNKTLAMLAGTALLCVHGWGMARTLSVNVVDKDGKPVPDAVVVVTTTARGQPRQELPASATVSQARMRFVPAVTIVPVGARVNFVNDDAFDHHVRGVPAGAAQFTAKDTDGFVLRLDGKVAGKPASAEQVAMTKAGPLALSCHIHQSMRGHVYVTDSPWTRLTQADGKATFDDLPAGAAQVRVWSADQLFDLPPQAVAAGSEPQQLTVRLTASMRPRR
ncbi:cupredoxin domain-containing protein [Ramlibacter tataouinensis]|uniref:Plastocyanin n=1 Tax=Ramlibacter tataouinensis (strain ATCC BAA-407 / DSM 14655 / LMG 21543 / TTB310) TaxID=365046 RepID=F5XWV4_RAMTT|nr:hypothetical protein [Ramlibacter tataouinensis]AEG91715.1 Conserved hypothetical protein [Ramlibacter tataouinensis TTB310]